MMGTIHLTDETHKFQVQERTVPHLRTCHLIAILRMNHPPVKIDLLCSPGEGGKVESPLATGHLRATFEANRVVSADWLCTKPYRETFRHLNWILPCGPYELRQLLDKITSTRTPGIAILHLGHTLLISTGLQDSSPESLTETASRKRSSLESSMALRFSW